MEELEDLLEEEEKEYPEARKWMFTCNNPQDHDWSIEKIIAILSSWKAVKYWCIGSEVGVENHTPHIHFFIWSKSPISAKTIENKFHGIDRRVRHGSIMSNRTYVFKDGKFIGTDKGNLHDYDSNQESGDPPEEKGRGHRSDMEDLYNMIKDGTSTYDILEKDPRNIKYLELIENTRQVVLMEKYKGIRRLDMHVEYWYGPPGIGKSRMIRDLYGDEKIYVVGDIKHPWDSYKGQDIVLFDDIRADYFNIHDMQRWLDIYPLELPSRYHNKTACFTKVFFLSNIPFDNLYKAVQQEDVISWNAFCRRFHKIKVLSKNEKGEMDINDYGTLQDYFSRFQDKKGFIKITDEQQLELDEMFGG